MGRNENANVGEDNNLVRMILVNAAENDLSQVEVADDLGISYQYWRSLANGNRPIHGADHKIFQAAARLLGIPTAQAYLLSGRMQPSDFFIDTGAAQLVKETMKMIRNDPEWTGYLPSQKKLNESNEDLLVLLSMVYLKTKQIDFNDVIKTLKK